MTNPHYDPRKAHDYYERHKHLKGRQSHNVENVMKTAGSTKVVKRKNPQMAKTVDSRKSAQMRVVRLVQKLHSLQNALKQAEEALANKRKEAKQNSDGKTTVKERNASKKYRDTHKAQIAAKEKKSATSTPSSSSGGSSSGPKSVADMSESELTDRVSKIKGLISTAKKQIQAANSLAHSMSDSEFISHGGLSTVNTN